MLQTPAASRDLRTPPPSADGHGARPVPATEDLARAVLSSHPAHIAVLDRDGAIVMVNDAWERFAHENGATTPEQVGLGANYLTVCGAAVHGERGEEAPQAADGIRAVLEGRRPIFQLEYPCHSHTVQRWFLMTVTPLKHAGGGAVVSHLDITERKRHEQLAAKLVMDIQIQRKRMDELLANVPGVVWEAYGRPDAEAQRMDFVSGYVERLLGYRVEEWLGKPGFWLSIVHAEDRDTVARQSAEIYDSCQPGMMEFRWVGKNGQVLWVESQVMVICEEPNRPIGMRGVTMDISSRKAAETALRDRAVELSQLARQLKKSNDELDQFAYIASHDLRAPLRGISNLSSWIEEDLGATSTISPEAQRMLDLLRGRVARMEALIDGVLEYSRIGRVRGKPERVDVAALLAETIDLISPPTGARVEVQSHLPVLVTERLRLQQVFLNLINNAIKHHPDASSAVVSITCRDAGDYVEFSVADNGKGIDPQYHEKVFVIFQTLEARDKVEATGVGLSLVKKIVESQGGHVRLESQPGKGATFHFTWPRGGSTSASASVIASARGTQA
jgi:PAS domain S-box-containing protein